MDVRIGVLGGTFDPPHIGHLAAAEEVRTQLHLERMLFVPAGTPPHKVGDPITPAHHRVEMIRRAVASNPHFFVSLIDVERPGPSYSVDTVRLLREKWDADTGIFFVIGMDMLADLPNWREPQRLVELCRLAVVNRPGYEVDMEKLEAAIPGLAEKMERVAMPLLEISGTALRRRIRGGRTIRYYVPAEVEAYVQAQGLYRSASRG